MLKTAEQTCGEAQKERNRLLKRANQFNHKPEKQEVILQQADRVSGLDSCEKVIRYKNLMAQNIGK